MKISELLNKKEPTLSFEVFPPKTSDLYDGVKAATDAIADLKPDFMSVTYGAGGSTQGYTTEIAANVKKRGVVSLAHLTCVNASHESLKEQLGRLKENGIENILALRGDLPAGVESTDDWVYRHASDLIPVIREAGDFCIGGACYPEKHPESRTLAEDIANIRIKVDAGCEFLTTQMFFDNTIFFNYLYRLREAGINVPVVAGIMPVTNARQMERILKLSQAFLPRRFVSILDRFGDDPKAMRQAGIAYATDQIIDLIASGINNIHIYTMNKPGNAEWIMNNLSEIIPSCRKQ
ncbi:MAG: methylenetetrahydrofolate reductase [NAD(P)H] [Lachnospiraceae bacterium]|nr:methylenetetrahydrofolate reductase [NAD(P)H] [Lachnospiraceae bacterium]